jgi:subtilisin family serine protease
MMTDSLRIKSTYFRPFAAVIGNDWARLLSSRKQVSVLFILAVLILSGVPARGIAKTANEREDNPTEVIELNSKNERKLEADLEKIRNAASPDTDGLIYVGNGNKNNKYAVLQIEYKNALWRRKNFTDSKVSKVPGVAVLTTIDRFADVFLPADNKIAFSQIYDDPNVVRVEWTTSVPIPPPPPLVRSTYSIKGVPEAIVRGGFQDLKKEKLTGKNVIVAVVDTGIDFTHPDFITLDAAGKPMSRLLYLWDPSLDFRVGRGKKGPFSYPNQTPIGTLFTQEQLTAELRNLKESKAAAIPSTDENGHGTACASIATGNGSSDFGEGGLKRPEVVGVAPDAMLIGVRIDKNDSLRNAYLLNAVCEWLSAVAGDRPLVVSSSFGGNHTGHDGRSVSERELNERFENGNKKGRIMVAAAGNEAGKSIHARVLFGNKNNSKLVSWNVENPDAQDSATEKPDPQAQSTIRLYFDRGSAKDIRILAPAASNITKENFTWEYNKITRQVEAALNVGPGKGQIQIFNTTGIQTEAHLYFDSAKSGTFEAGVDNSYLIASPGTAESVITVGSSAWNNNFHRSGGLIELTASCRDKEGKYTLFEVGGLSCYSSPGPTRDNRYKPDLIAPGEWYTASYAKDSKGWKKDRLDSTGKYIPMNGTSAATPYTAGIIALLFERRPDLSANGVKELFRNNLTRSDLKPFLGQVPNRYWGNGKLDLDSITRIFRAMDDWKEPS